MKVFLGLVLVAMAHGALYGPCKKVTTVNVDTRKWAGTLFLNLMTNNPGQSCSQLRRYFVNKTEGKIGEEYQRIVDGKPVTSSVVGEYVDVGHYKFTAEKIPGKKSEFQDYFLHFDPPRLTIQYVCTADPAFKDGQPAVFMLSAYPDAAKKNAPIIKKVLEANGFGVENLMLVDNCKCKNLVYKTGPSKCKKLTIKDYFNIKG